MKEKWKLHRHEKVVVEPEAVKIEFEVKLVGLRLGRAKLQVVSCFSFASFS
jgi:hypothetical protein